MPTTVRATRRAFIPSVLAAAVLGGALLVQSADAASAAVPAYALAPQTTLTATYTSPGVRRALDIARHQQGDPYSYGAAGPNAFDCSGLVYFATHRAGFDRVPRTSSAQAGFMRHIRRTAMRAGDFVFFTSGSSVYHVGVYVGDHTVLHAPYSGNRVRKERIWTNSWFPATLRRRG